MNCIQIAYRSPEIKELYQKAGIQTSASAGYDLILCEDVVFERPLEFKSVDLGVVIRVPEGMHSLVIPRSSTFGKYRLMQSNGIGLIDRDYCGEKDFWRMPLVYLGEGPLQISKGTRLCQFILMPTIPITQVEEFVPSAHSRGGFGSTGS